MERDKAKFDILNKILEERTKRGWSEYTLAQNAGLTQSTISTWYRKDLQPSVASIEKVCNGLGITLSQFFFDPETETRYPLTENQRRMVDKWAALTPEQQRILMELIEQMQQSKE